MYKEIMEYSYNGLQWRNDICYLWQYGLISKHNKTSLYSNLQKENYSVPRVSSSHSLCLVFRQQKIHFESVSLKVLLAQACPTLWWLHGLPSASSPICGVLQARILEWVAIPFSGGSSQRRDRTPVSCITGKFFTLWATREALEENRTAL